MIADPASGFAGSFARGRGEGLFMPDAPTAPEIEQLSKDDTLRAINILAKSLAR